MFESGDAVFHPVRGAGIVRGVEKRRWHGDNVLYYTIELLGQPGTKVMIPTSVAKEIGLRRAMSRTKLKKMWTVLGGDPRKLPADHKDRYELLKEKLHAGDVLKVAEAVRDMAWRREREGYLTTRGKRLYDKGMMFLAGEIAAVRGVDLTEAEMQVTARLRESLAPASVM
jgi:RNA polymerase-interacting CarD/CdnL/TRCF family regulator